MADSNIQQHHEEPQVAMPSNNNQPNEYRKEPNQTFPIDDTQQTLLKQTEANNAICIDNESGEYVPPKEETLNATVQVDNKSKTLDLDNDNQDIVDKREDLYDADNDGIVDDEMFKTSTHSFAVYFGRRRDIDGLIIAYFVFIMQMSLYTVCGYQVLMDLKGDEFTVPVTVRFGKTCSQPNNLGMFV